MIRGRRSRGSGAPRAAAGQPAQITRFSEPRVQRRFVLKFTWIDNPIDDPRVLASMQFREAQHVEGIIARDLGPELERSAQSYPVVTVTGPRQSGKTTLCKQTFPDKPWVSLEPIDTREFANTDPRGFLAQYADGAILDEIQRAPDLLSYLQTEVDSRPDAGRFILTGSENLALSERVSQSLAGRNRTLFLLPPSHSELQRFGPAAPDLLTTIWTGAYPRIHHRHPARERPLPQDWLSDYIRDYLERDVRQISRVTNLRDFRKLLVLAAGRTAQELNYSRLGADVGVTHATARAWVSLLETSFVAFTLPAWHRNNVRKQQVKAPKLHFFDTGLLCALLGIRSPEQLQSHPSVGAIFETWVASEVLKARLHRGLNADAFHYRESRGLEVDLVVDDEELFLVEVKLGATIVDQFFGPLRKLREDVERSGRPRAVRSVLVYGGAQRQERSDVSVIPWNEIQSVDWSPSRDEAPSESEDSSDTREFEARRQRVIGGIFEQFAAGGRFHGRYDLPDARSLQPLARHARTWQLPIFPVATASAHVLRVYELGDAPDDLITAHWRNEARALHRLATSGHPAIPRLHDSGQLRINGSTFGFLVLEDTGQPVVPGHALLQQWQQRPDLAFQEFVMLVESVALVHEEGLLHRTLSPAATRAADDADAAIMLDDFQLSAFAATWLAPADSKPALPSADAPPWSWACWAPERLEAIAGTETQIEGFASDVFALGMLGLGWLVVPFDQWRLESILVGDSYDPQAHRAWLEQLEESADASPLPLSLRRLLLAMLAFESSARPANAREIYDQLCRMYGAVLTTLEQRATRPATMQLHYLAESVDRLYKDGRARTPPSARDPREYAEIIINDLSDGVLAWSPEGPVPWVRERDPERIQRMQSARIVLMGEHYSYFCQYLHHGRPGEDRRVIVVKYMVEARRTQEMHRHPRLRPLPEVEPRLFDPKVQHQRPLPEDTPSWEPLVVSTKFEPRHPASAPLVQAGRWLLSVQLAELTLQEYPVERLMDSEGVAMLRQEQGTDVFDDDSEASAFVRLHLSRRERPGMGTLFEELHRQALEDDREQAFELRTSRKHRHSERLHLERKVDEHTVVLRERGDLPSRGFLRPDDTGSRYVHGRQAAALDAVEKRHPYLAAQIAAPTAVEIPPERPYSADGLDEPTQQLIGRILSSWPLFVLQGPPGTGKTFVARHVVRAILEQDPFARVLVAAQSHHALDNLLEGVDGEIDEDYIRLRGSTSRVEDKLSTIAKEHTLGGSVGRVLERVKASEARTSDPVLTAIAKRWRRHSRKEADLTQRVQRSASVTFSTCTAATARALGIDAGGGFDWVIVEEAARAWITELLMPMLHGTRWLLIGDHRQLPPFKARQVRQLLAKDAADQVTAPATGVEVDREWDRFLGHFEHLMGAPAAPYGFDPRHTLTTQRRMHPEIGTLVSQVFYDGKLQSHADTSRPHGLQVPAFVQGTALVWVDTGSHGEAAKERQIEQGGYDNACEAHIVTSLLPTFAEGAATQEPGIPPLFVLTPYRAQAAAIRQGAGVEHQRLVDTIDAFQGREAEVVVLSLVRSNASGSERSRIGFLGEPERTNVLLSRARRLLVIVGDLECFARSNSDHWAAIVQYVRSEPRFLVDAKRELKLEWPPRRKSRRRPAKTTRTKRTKK